MREEKLRIVSVNDPAIDTERMLPREMREYYESRDIALIGKFILPGSIPTVFHVREVPRGLWESYVCAGGDDAMAQRYLRAFMCGVEVVKDLYQRDGVRLPEWKPSKRAGDNVVMSEEEAFERFSPAEREEIGRVIYQHSFLALRIALRFELPSSCLEQLGQRAFRRADANQSAAAATSSEKPSESSTQPPEATVNV